MKDYRRYVEAGGHGGLDISAARFFTQSQLPNLINGRTPSAAVCLLKVSGLGERLEVCPLGDVFVHHVRSEPVGWRLGDGASDGEFVSGVVA